MTENTITLPIMPTTSQSTTTTVRRTPSFNRRTISSATKNVNVKLNDIRKCVAFEKIRIRLDRESFLESQELERQELEKQELENQVLLQNKVLMRRHSTIQLNRTVQAKPQRQKKQGPRTRALSYSDLRRIDVDPRIKPQQEQEQEQQDPRTRTLSNNDSKDTKVCQQTKQQTKQQQQQQQQQQQTETDSAVLEEVQEALKQHAENCEPCFNNNNNNNNNEQFSSEYEEEEEEEENSPSPSTSSSSNDQDSLVWRQKSSGSLLHNVEQREQIIKELNSSMTSYSSQIKELSNGCCDDEEEYRLKIAQCESLVSQQMVLLNKLYFQNITTATTTCAEAVPKTAPTPPLEKNSTFIQSICNGFFYKGFKSTTTGITIRQKQDKKKVDTIVSVQGVCTTVERSLIPDNLLVSADDQQSVYQNHYSIDITHSDRQTKFKLLLHDEWQKDEKVSSCAFKECSTEFNWFQRKHHCRACGDIYCNTHSGNRLPLFSAKETVHPVFSRVCDTCFYSLANNSLH
ncbi:hypothetical protein EDC94DRAFT_645652 [Helicostylum pulchrum]|nr:hypothetical protein EDC94DRAFT_645652 [Helicostylum pulchrum]